MNTQRTWGRFLLIALTLVACGGGSGEEAAESPQAGNPAATPGNPVLGTPPSTGDAVTPSAPTTPTPPENGPPSGVVPSSEVEFFSFAAQNQLQDPRWGEKLTDLLRHVPAAYANPAQADRIVWARETTRLLDEHVRNNFNKTGKRASGFYVLADRALVLSEPNTRKSQAAALVPGSLRGSRFGYFNANASDDARPLYLLDQWIAFSNGGEVALELVKTGLTRTATDALAGQYETMVYVLAVGLAVERNDPGYAQANPAFKNFLAWNLKRSMGVYREGVLIPQLTSEAQETYENRFRTAPEASALRQYVRRTFGPDFARDELGLDVKDET